MRLAARAFLLPLALAVALLGLLAHAAPADVPQEPSTFSICRDSSDSNRARPECIHAAATITADPARTAVTQPVWQLCGAILSPQVDELENDETCSDNDDDDASCGFFRLSWSAPPDVATAAGAPPLLYSVFAEWDAPTLTSEQPRETGSHSDDSDKADSPSLQPTIVRHSMLVCESSVPGGDDSAGSAALECRVPRHALPRGVPLELHLMAECDYLRLSSERESHGAGAGALLLPLPRCRSAVSPTVHVVLPPSPTPPAHPQASSPSPRAVPTHTGAPKKPRLARSNNLDTSSSPTILAAGPTPAAARTALLQDDSSMRAALTLFYNATSAGGSAWLNAEGWLDSDVPACDWHGVTCDTNRTALVALELKGNGLSSEGCVDLSGIFAQFPSIVVLDLDGNSALCLRRLDLAAHAQLDSLILSGVGTPEAAPLLLPDPSSLTVLDLSSGAWDFDLSGSAALRYLHLTNSRQPFSLANIPVGPDSPFALIALDNADVRGDLRSLCPLPQLAHLLADNSGLSSMLPVDIAACWPQLDTLSLCCSNLHGPLPAFVNLPRLTVLQLNQNSLSGTVPSQWDLPLLSQLTFANNQLGGELPPDLFDHLPKIEWLDLSSNRFVGPVPSAPSLRVLRLLALSDNQFSGPLPANLTSQTYDLSYNNLSGPLILRGVPLEDLVMTKLNLAMTRGLECPIRLGGLDVLRTLDLRGTGFDGCDFEDQSMVQLPQKSLKELDISHNNWLPMTLPLYPSLVRVTAIRASVRALSFQSTLDLQELTLDHSVIRPPPPSQQSQTDVFGDLCQRAPKLRYLSCNNCSLQTDIFQFLSALSYKCSELVVSLQFNSNSFSGILGADTFATSHGLLPPALKQLDLSYNPGLIGHLPPAGSSYTALRELNFAGTGLTGALPVSWNAFSGLQHLTLSDTKLQCPMVVDENGQLRCHLPSWITVSDASTDGGTGGEGGGVSPGFHCPELDLVSQNFSTVDLDETYYVRTFCRCDANYFGRDGVCVRCPAQCSCSGDVIRNCFPVVTPGQLRVDSDRRVVSHADNAPFAVRTFLSCPRTLKGTSLCNPDGASWPGFYEVVPVLGGLEGGARAELSVVPALNLTAWCYPGHAGRMCASCAAGYFSSGRWCLRCLSRGVHALIIAVNVALLLLLVAFLYARMPNAAGSAAALREYEAQHQKQHRRGPLPSDAEYSAAHPGLPSTGSVLSDLSASVSIADSQAMVESSSRSSGPVLENKAVAANPLKLLIFHSQQLGLLLQTTASLPPALTGFLGIISTGSSSFSLSSLVALECLSGAWTMANRCWLALAAPLLIGLVAFAISLNNRRRTHGRVSLGSDSSVTENELRSERTALQPGGQSRTPRIYGVCVSLLYLMVFPCAETALSALTCTDLREDERGSDGSARVFLNLFPGQQCDAEWQRTVLPPALLGVLVWFLAFPVGSTLLFRHLRRQLMQRSAITRHQPGVDPLVAAARAESAAAAVWPLCSDLLRPYSRQYWYWEQVLLVRRLLLVAAVSVIPSASLYLPLALFSLVQLSALLQHWMHPYRHSLLNSAELASLYLLLLNYLTALVLQTDVSVGGFASSGNLWATLLFVINLLFLLALIAALFQFARTAAAAAFGRVRAWVAGWLCVVGSNKRRRQLQRKAAARQARLDALAAAAASSGDWLPHDGAYQTAFPSAANGGVATAPRDVAASEHTGQYGAAFDSSAVGSPSLSSSASGGGFDSSHTAMRDLAPQRDRSTLPRTAPVALTPLQQSLRTPLLDSSHPQ